jgi:hypothetical protein
LLLQGDDGDRTVTDEEIAGLQTVTAGNRIKACRGFDFFLLIGESA